MPVAEFGPPELPSTEEPIIEEPTPKPEPEPEVDPDERAAEVAGMTKDEFLKLRHDLLRMWSSEPEVR